MTWLLLAIFEFVLAAVNVVVAVWCFSQGNFIGMINVAAGILCIVCGLIVLDY